MIPPAGARSNRALATTDAHRALVLNLARQRGDTDLMSTADHDARSTRVRSMLSSTSSRIRRPVTTSTISSSPPKNLARARPPCGRCAQVMGPITARYAYAAALRDTFDGFLG